MAGTRLVLGPGALRSLRKDRVLLLYDPKVPARLRREARARWRIPARVPEGAKRLATLERLARACVRAGLGRDGTLAVMGGGVLCDLGALLGALYLRGIPVVLIPTTLLAQADAAFGGKNGVDLPEGKNLLGTFRAPQSVLCDPRTLRSLPLPRIREGLAEILKCALLDGPGALADLERDAGRLLARDESALVRAVAMSLRVKRRHVGADPFERSGRRERLNLGHTLAHAAEAASDYRLSHGRAVAAGLCAALDVSRRLGVLRDPGLPARVRALLARLGLPASFPDGLARRRVLEAARRDKKVRAGRVRMVLPVRTGRTVTREVPRRVLAAALGLR